MKKIIACFWVYFFKAAIWLRYRLKVKGYKEVISEVLSHPEGTIFLSNHTSMLDAILLLSVLWPRLKTRPIGADFIQRSSILRYFVEQYKIFYIPSFDSATNSYKRLLYEETFSEIVSCLKNKESLLIYPSGMLKVDASESIGGNSGVHDLLARAPNSNVVLVRMTGLWGSNFSKALTGKSPDIVPTFLNGISILLKNLIFFTPRREVEIELETAPKDFPRKADRLTLNRYLEEWFNRNGPEPLKLISFSRWGVHLPIVYQRPKEKGVNLDTIPQAIKEQVIKEVAEIAHIAEEEVTPEKDFAFDLGLDSLDRSQLVLILKEQFGVSHVTATDLTTVASMMAYAAHLREGSEEEEVEELPISKWFHTEHRPPPSYPKEASTLIEAFLQTATNLDGQAAATDQMVGEISYSRLKLGIILFARYIKRLPDKSIGIMLPASIAANMLTLAVQLGGKVPVMINWTLGSRNLDAILQQTKLETVISSWKFLDRLDNAEFGKVNETILLVEKIKNTFTLREKLSAKLLARKSPKAILKALEAETIKSDDEAVILFTSGTESLPKGVPLSHRNLMENQRGAFNLFEMKKNDVMLGFLPPFHSFGFSITGLFPLIIGMRVAYYADPTNGRQIANQIHRWKVTLICSPPTFLKFLFRASMGEKLSSIRGIISGAEKASDDLIEKIYSLNSEIQFLEGYGITECAPILTINQRNLNHIGVGKPLSQVDLTIVKPDTLEPLPPGEPGLILARGPNIFSGYLEKTAKSPFVEVDGKTWYNTGDLGSIDKEGCLTLTGRLKRFIKIGGEMVSLGAIETVLLEEAKERGWEVNPDISPLAVIALEEEGKKGELHFFSTFEADKNELNSILKEKGMSNLIRLHTVHKVHVIPKLGTGKIDYRSLTKKLQEQDG
ncbi:MAG: Bifunctional protein Aas [Chlamydiales bacterium]|nr:Bifunctional protein Aas [Chlamydiales bacterium]MCH9619889.1 Bifunctional protein Aas [Chlamydiales bacterium]MCH9622684.1 Bifunctional protein Aas [Chlamydiales bacterium]